MFFFLPVGDENSTRRVPWMTYLLILVNVLVFLMVATRPDYQSVVNEYGFRPDQPSFGDALTSAFLHAGILHLIGNMLYLWIVGDNVEDTLGAFGFLAFYLGGAVAADYVHMAAVSPGLVSLPTIGASGAVAAVLGAYLLLFPTHAIRYWGIILISRSSSGCRPCWRWVCGSSWKSWPRCCPVATPTSPTALTSAASSPALPRWGC